MTPTANVNSDILRERRTRLDFVATATARSDLFVTRMNVCLHVALEHLVGV